MSGDSIVAAMLFTLAGALFNWAITWVISGEPFLWILPITSYGIVMFYFGIRNLKRGTNDSTSDEREQGSR
jgi:hypothetical protein